MTVLGWALIVLGFLAYLFAFAQGPGPTMGDKPAQALSFTLGTLLMVGGFVLVAVI